MVRAVPARGTFCGMKSIKFTLWSATPNFETHAFSPLFHSSSVQAHLLWGVSPSFHSLSTKTQARSFKIPIHRKMIQQKHDVYRIKSTNQILIYPSHRYHKISSLYDSECFSLDSVRDLGDKVATSGFAIFSSIIYMKKLLFSSY